MFSTRIALYNSRKTKQTENKNKPTELKTNKK